MPYEYPTVITDVPGLFEYPNTVTDGWFWSVILLCLWVVIFLTVYNHEYDSREKKMTSRAYAAASFPVGMLCLLMYIVSPPLVNVFVAGLGGILILTTFIITQVD